jgi:hypothetical protein
LVISGLLDPLTLQNLELAAQSTIENTPKVPFYFDVTKTGGMFGSTSANRATSAVCDRDTAADAFRQTALFSDLPRAAAELMQLDAASQNVRILR